MKIKEKQVKLILTKSNLPGIDFVVNPYIGCKHSCVYCYADFMKRFTGHANEKWGEFVDIKINAYEKIPLKIPKNAKILMSSVTDPYQPIEAKYEITRKCLKRLLPLQPNLEILTKSPLILRDIDLLKQFKNLKIGISIGIFNEKYAKELESCVVSPKKRLEVLKKLHKEGISTYLFVSPIFPEISNQFKIISVAKNYVNEIFFENLNIRANNRERVLNFIKKTKPNLEDLYKSLPKNRIYWDKIEKEIIKECKNNKVKYKIFFHHGKD